MIYVITQPPLVHRENYTDFCRYLPVKYTGNVMDDPRNVTDEFKNRSEAEIRLVLDKRGVALEIAIENLTRDFNMGTIVRSANAFGVRRVHVIGRRQWNKRGAMATDKYLHVQYHASVKAFADDAARRGKEIVAVDNVPAAASLAKTALPPNAVLVFGAEGPGVSSELLSQASQIIAIEQLGSTRSINVGVAAGIAMYAWLQEYYLPVEKKPGIM